MLDKVRGLGKTQLDELATVLLKQCQSEVILPKGEVDWKIFHEYREHIHSTFSVPQTSITTLTSRVLYGIGYLSRPRRLIGIGTYYGNAICWLAGAGFSSNPFRVYEGEKAFALDVDQEAIQGFEQNKDKAHLMIDNMYADGIVWLKENTEPIDLLYLDLDVPEGGKEGYSICFQMAKEQLSSGSLVVAHDYYEEKFADNMQKFREEVMPYAQKFMALKTDKYGLAVIKI